MVVIARHNCFLNKKQYFRWMCIFIFIVSMTSGKVSGAAFTNHQYFLRLDWDVVFVKESCSVFLFTSNVGD